MADPMNDAILRASGLKLSFGALTVLDDVDLIVPRGEVLGVLGPNGAGKTSLMNVLTGALRPAAGTVHLGDRDVTGLDTAARCRAGLARSHQIPRPFGRMTVFENAMVAALHGGTAAKPEDAAWEALDLAGLGPKANRPAESLGLMDRKRLELARAVATEPRVLLLDEIGGGLTSAEGEGLLEIVRVLVSRGLTIVWIEHVMRLLTAACDRMICMAGGRILADGAPSQVMDAPAVREAYFGVAA